MLTTQTATVYKSRPIRLALLNGVKTTAQKYGCRWMVGGDFPQPGDTVLIAALHKDVENGGQWWGWHKLRGSFLVFNDFMTDSEIAEQSTIDKARRNP